MTVFIHLGRRQWPAICHSRENVAACLKAAGQLGISGHWGPTRTLASNPPRSPGSYKPKSRAHLREFLLPDTWRGKLIARLAKHHWRSVWKQSKGRALTKNAPGEKGRFFCISMTGRLLPVAYPRRTVLFSHGTAFGPDFSGASLIHYRGRRGPAGSDGQLTWASAITLRFSLCG